MAAAPPNLGFGGPNGEPAFEMNRLGEQAIPAGDPANMAEANGENGESLSKKREKARQFAPRHIQMMALGTFLQF
jgi:amino acid permease